MFLKVNVNYSQNVNYFFFYKREWVCRVLRILNLKEHENCKVWFKSYKIFKLHFFIKFTNISNIGIWGVYPKGTDGNLVLCTWILLELSEILRNTKLGQKPVSEIGLFQKVFRIWLQIHSPKLKSKWTASNSSLLPLYKHPTCLCMIFFPFLQCLKNCRHF